MICAVIKSVAECNGVYTIKFFENEFIVKLDVEKSAFKSRPKPKRHDVIEATVENGKLIFFLNGEMIKEK